MSARRACCFVIALLAFLTAQAVPASAAGGKPNPHPLFTDPVGDVTPDPFGTTDAGVDITAFDATDGAGVVSLSIEVADVDAPFPSQPIDLVIQPTGRTYNVDFTVSGRPFGAGASTYRAGYPSSFFVVRLDTYPNPEHYVYVDGSVDPVTNRVTIDVPLAVLNGILDPTDPRVERGSDVSAITARALMWRSTGSSNTLPQDRADGGPAVYTVGR